MVGFALEVGDWAPPQLTLPEPLQSCPIWRFYNPNWRGGLSPAGSPRLGLVGTPGGGQPLGCPSAPTSDQRALGRRREGKTLLEENAAPLLAPAQAVVCHFPGKGGRPSRAHPGRKAERQRGQQGPSACVCVWGGGLCWELGWLQATSGSLNLPWGFSFKNRVRYCD